MTKNAVAAIKISDVLRPKGGGETPVNTHVVTRPPEPEPDYEAMRRVVAGGEDVDDEVGVRVE